MQPTEGFSIPRRAMDVEDYIDVVRRHKGWIFGPFLFTVVVAVVSVYLYPDSYESEAVITIEPQKVPENMVQSAVNQAMNERIQAIALQIESRSVLATVISNFDLYRKERNQEPTDDVVELMKSKIFVVPVLMQGAQQQKASAFAIRYSYENREKAQKVTEDLVARFLDYSRTNRSAATLETSKLMQDLRDSAQKELDDVENRLTTFRLANSGKLPDQMDGNRQQFLQLQANASILKNQYDGASQAKLNLESNISILKDRLVALNKEAETVPVAVQSKSQKLVDAERQVDLAQAALTTLQQQYKENFPDVLTAKAQLQEAKNRRDDIAAQEDAARKATATVHRVEPQLAAQIQSTNEQIRAFQSQSEAKSLEMQELSKAMSQSNKDMQRSTSLMEATPISQKEYDDLYRDRDLAKAKYEDAARTLARARTSEEMENRSQGETLNILNPPSRPSSPSEPKRGLDISIAAAVGLLLGIVTAGAREMKDTSLKNLKDVRAYTKMSILGSIPLLENDFVVRRRRRLAWLGWTTACLTAAVVISGSIVYYYATRQ